MLLKLAEFVYLSEQFVRKDLIRGYAFKRVLVQHLQDYVFRVFAYPTETRMTHVRVSLLDKCKRSFAVWGLEWKLATDESIVDNS